MRRTVTLGRVTPKLKGLNLIFIPQADSFKLSTHRVIAFCLLENCTLLRFRTSLAGPNIPSEIMRSFPTTAFPHGQNEDL